MPVLKLKQGRYQVASQVVDNNTFTAWAESDGRGALVERYRKLKAAWFFGRYRARRQLIREARAVLAPGTTLAVVIEHELDKLPEFIRRIGHAIRRRGIRDLFTTDRTYTVVVIPRGLVQHDFTVSLLREVTNTRELEAFPGLAKRVLSRLALDAEELMFQEIDKGRPYPDESGKGLVIGVDAEFRWQLNDVNGHYLYGYTVDEDEVLSDRRSLRRFRNKLKELIHGQEVHLRRMPVQERAALTETFEAAVAARRHTAGARADATPVPA
jgi:hypothetical protein